MKFSKSGSALTLLQRELRRAHDRKQSGRRVLGRTPVAVWVAVLGLAFGSEACQVYGGDLLDGTGTIVSASQGGSAANEKLDASFSGAGGEGADNVGPAVTGPDGSGGSVSMVDDTAQPLAVAGSGGALALGGSSSGGSGSGSASGGSTSGGEGGTGAGAPCAGESVSGHCVYLGATGDSCEQTCAGHGGLAVDAASFLGTPAQGGSLDECTLAMKALGIALTPVEATRDDGRGLGCHLYASRPYWLASPAFTSTASYWSTRIVCACQQ